MDSADSRAWTLDTGQIHASYGVGLYVERGPSWSTAGRNLPGPPTCLMQVPDESRPATDRPLKTPDYFSSSILSVNAALHRSVYLCIKKNAVCRGTTSAYFGFSRSMFCRATLWALCVRLCRQFRVPASRISRSTQPCIPLGSLNRVPTLIG